MYQELLCDQNFIGTEVLVYIRVGPNLDMELALSHEIFFAQVKPNLIIFDALLVIWLNSPEFACQLEKRLFTNAEMTSTRSRHSHTCLQTYPRAQIPCQK